MSEKYASQRGRKAVPVNFLDAILYQSVLMDRNIIARIALAFGANPDTENNFLQSVLHLAVLYNNNPLAENLISYGASVNARDREGKTPIFYALSANNFVGFNLLMKKGGFLNVYEEDGLNPIHFCVARGNLKALQFLLAHDNVTLIDKLLFQRNIRGQTPLSFALGKDDLESGLLLSKRIDELADEELKRKFFTSCAMEFNALLDKYAVEIPHKPAECKPKCSSKTL